jgi:putative hydrolase of the HAD superfamily
MNALAGIRHVLFDAVGTLIYPAPSVAEVYAALGQQFGSRLSAAEIRPRFAVAFGREAPTFTTSEPGERRRWQQIVAEVFDDVTGDALFESLWHHFASGQHWRLFDDVSDTWQELEGRGFQPGIASNFDGRLRTVIQSLAPLDSCQSLFISAELGYAKPDPRFFAAIERHLQAEPRELLLVGDDPVRDVRAARAITSPGTLRDLRELL